MSDNGNKDKLLKKKVLNPIIDLFENNESISNIDLLELFKKFEDDDFVVKESYWYSPYNHNCGFGGEFIVTEKLSYDDYKTTILFNYYIYNCNFSFIEFKKISESLSLIEPIFLIQRNFMHKEFRKSVDLLC